MTSQPSSHIRAFNIDFNWDQDGLAFPGGYTHADPAEHLRWYRDLGVNTIQTFCVAANGYAWYPTSRVAPVTPGLRGDFLGELTRLAHAEGIRVMGYFCLGANPHWEALHPELIDHKSPNYFRIPLTDAYLDDFCGSVRDALEQTEIDGFMVDWIRARKRTCWPDVEKRMYREFLRVSFPEQAPPDAPEFVEFERRALERAWVRIKEAVVSVRPALIWTNHPFERVDDPIWHGHRLLKEVDWVLNEGPDPAILEWLVRECGEQVRIIQNLCGWKEHDAAQFAKIDRERFGLYGFAQADPLTTLPSHDYTPACAANERNIATLRALYRGSGSSCAARGSRAG